MKANAVIARNGISGLIFCSVVALALNSCGSSDTVNPGDVNETKIHRTYWVNYTEANQATNITAGFRVGGSTGTTISLVSPSKVTVEDAEFKLSGVEPKQSNAWGTSYGWQLSGTPMSSAYRFTWVKPSGKKTEDVVAAINPYRMVVSNSKLSISQGVDIRLDRSISTATSTVQATLTPASQPEGASQEFAMATSGNSVFFEPRQLMRLAPGLYRVQILTRNRVLINSNTEDLGGELNSSYAANSETVNILP